MSKNIFDWIVFVLFLSSIFFGAFAEIYAFIVVKKIKKYSLINNGCFLNFQKETGSNLTKFLKWLKNNKKCLPYRLRRSAFLIKTTYYMSMIMVTIVIIYYINLWVFGF